LLEGLDGVDKMSKSKNNYIGIKDEPNEMFAKVLSISDDLMWRWYPLLSFKTAQEVEQLKSQIAAGLNPKVVKVALANEITSRFHGPAAALRAEEDFALRSKGGIPSEIPQMNLSMQEGQTTFSIGALLRATGLASSAGEGNRLIDGAGVKINGQVISDKGLKLDVGVYTVQVGKRKFLELTLSAADA
jgi:tyrosyl-tRNA synthetase